MENMVNVYLFGKKYTVPDNLTIMEAMEYSGYKLVRGVGCRNGFCGACATVYRVKGDRELHAALACAVLWGLLRLFPVDCAVFSTFAGPAAAKSVSVSAPAAIALAALCTVLLVDLSRSGADHGALT